MHLENLGEAVPDRRETDKALYMSLSMVCKNEALDVVKTVTHKRGLESWRKLSKEYGATTGTSLHEYTNLFGIRFSNHGWIQEWENRLLTSRRRQVKCSVTGLKMCNCAVKISSFNNRRICAFRVGRLRSSSSCIDELPGG